jgi:hypothetical protein
MSMTWTCVENVSIFFIFLDMFYTYGHRLDMKTTYRAIHVEEAISQ